jgi:hypothetical protein
MPDPGQPASITSPPPPTYVTPIACPLCGADAHLIRQTYDFAVKAERRTFECKECCALTEMIVD